MMIVNSHAYLPTSFTGLETYLLGIIGGNHQHYQKEKVEKSYVQIKILPCHLKDRSARCFDSVSIDL